MSQPELMRFDEGPRMSRRALLQVSAATLTCVPAASTHAAVDRFEDLPPVPMKLPLLVRRECRFRDGATIRYVTAGRGPVTLVLLHGSNCNWRFFAPQFAALSTAYSIVALDLAGHGDSSRRVGQFSVQAFVDDVAAVVEQSVPGPFVFVAHSTGGRVACAAAPQFGDRLLGMVGVDTFHNLAKEPPARAVVDGYVARLRTDFTASMREYIKPFFQPGTSPQLIAWVERQMLRTVPEDAAQAGGVLAAFDARVPVTGWPRPVVALNSDWVPLDYRKVRSVLPAFDLIVLAGRGHFPNLEDPAVFNPLIRVTVDRVARSAGI